jgi:hypothetical protein
MQVVIIMLALTDKTVVAKLAIFQTTLRKNQAHLEITTILLQTSVTFHPPQTSLTVVILNSETLLVMVRVITVKLNHSEIVSNPQEQDPTFLTILVNPGAQ